MLIDMYSSLEKNEKQKAETIAKLAVLQERLRALEVSPGLNNVLLALLSQLEQSNY